LSRSDNELLFAHVGPPLGSCPLRRSRSEPVMVPLLTCGIVAESL
jgi:hypothetical protein